MVRMVSAATSDKVPFARLCRHPLMWLHELTARMEYLWPIGWRGVGLDGSDASR